MIKKLNLFITMFLTATTITSCSKKLHLGKYQTNFATYGMFTNWIELKADSSFIKNFSGDMMNDYSYGTWRRDNDTLILVFDTIKHPKSRYKDIEKYVIKNKKLTFENRKTSIKKIKSHSFWDTLPKHQKKQILRAINKTPKNFRGTMRKQYYILRN